MGQLAHCPQCAVQLLLPNGSETAQIQCPTCKAIFAGDAAVMQPVAEAVVVASGTGAPQPPAPTTPPASAPLRTESERTESVRTGPAKVELAETKPKRTGSSFFGSNDLGNSEAKGAPNAGPDAALAALLAGRQPLRRADAAEKSMAAAQPQAAQPQAEQPQERKTPPEPVAAAPTAAAPQPEPAPLTPKPMSLAEAMQATKPAEEVASKPAATPEPSTPATKQEEVAPKFNLQELLNKQNASRPEPQQADPAPSFSAETPGAVPPQTQAPAKPSAPEPTEAAADPLLSKDFSFDLGRSIQQSITTTPETTDAASVSKPTIAPAVMPASVAAYSESELAEDSAEEFASDSPWPRKRSWIGPVAGAGVGLVIGYGLLVVIGGPERDVLGIARVMMGKSLPVTQASALPLGGSPSDSQATTANAEEDEASQSAPDPFNTPRRPEGIQVRYDEPAPVMARDGNAADFEAAEPPAFAADTPDALAAMPAEIENAPAYSLADLQRTLTATAEASRIMGEQSMSDPDQVVAVGQAYAELCELAQVVTFLEPDDSHPDMMMTRLEAQDVFRLLFEYRHTREETRQIAERWIDWTSRPHGGVFFAGVPGAAKPQGSVFEYRFRLASPEVSTEGGTEASTEASDSEATAEQDAATPTVWDDSNSVVVLSKSPLELNRFRGAESIGIVGCVIEDPAQKITGYRGDTPRAVWVTRTLPLSRPSFD